MNEKIEKGTGKTKNESSASKRKIGECGVLESKKMFRGERNNQLC